MGLRGAGGGEGRWGVLEAETAWRWSADVQGMGPGPFPDGGVMPGSVVSAL